MARRQGVPAARRGAGRRAAKAAEDARRAAPRASTRITARALRRDLLRLQHERGIGDAVLLGALCEVIAAHQPTARQAFARLCALLDQAGVR
ncbi:MAG: hypothetical protein NZ552_00415 [Planctomycetes bacterium]|nr:hypothetical protein [Planctomycetota bacterium]